MEYLLILIVVISVIVGVMVYLQAMSRPPMDQANDDVIRMLCSRQVCGGPADCDATGNCPSGATCNPGKGTCEMP